MVVFSTMVDIKVALYPSACQIRNGRLSIGRHVSPYRSRLSHGYSSVQSARANFHVQFIFKGWFSFLMCNYVRHLCLVSVLPVIDNGQLTPLFGEAVWFAGRKQRSTAVNNTNSNTSFSHKQHCTAMCAYDKS